MSGIFAASGLGGASAASAAILHEKPDQRVHRLVVGCVDERATFAPFAISSSGLPCARSAGAAANDARTSAILVTRGMTDDTFIDETPNGEYREPGPA